MSLKKEWINRLGFAKINAEQMYDEKKNDALRDMNKIFIYLCI